MHHIAHHHWSKNHPVSAGKKTFTNLKYDNYKYYISLKFTWHVCDLNTFHLLKTEGVTRRAAEWTPKSIIKKCQKFIKILILTSLKTS